VYATIHIQTHIWSNRLLLLGTNITQNHIQESRPSLYLSSSFYLSIYGSCVLQILNKAKQKIM